MAEPGAVLEAPVRKVVEGKGRPEARAGPIFGSLAVAVPVAEPALAVELARGLDRIAALARGADPDRVAEAGPSSDRVVEAVPAWDQGVRQVPEETKPPESSLPPWAGGDPPRHY